MRKSLAGYILSVILQSLALVILGSFIPAQNSVSLAGAPTLGFDGIIEVHKDAGDPDPIYSSLAAIPRVGLFHLHALRFEANSSVEWVIKKQSDGTQVLAGTLAIQEDGTGQSSQLRLPNGAYTVYYHQTGCAGCDKTEDFVVERQAEDPSAPPVIEPGEIVNPGNAPSDRLAQVSVVCQGCWSSTAQVWVGGTEQPSQILVPDANGVHAALSTFWNHESWHIRVRVTLPAELDASRWKLILWVGTGPQDFVWADEATFTLAPHELTKTSFQLVDTWNWQ